MPRDTGRLAESFRIDARQADDGQLSVRFEWYGHLVEAAEVAVDAWMERHPGPAVRRGLADVAADALWVAINKSRTKSPYWTPGRRPGIKAIP